MPELSSENPSRDELQIYLNEHWQKIRKLIDYYRDDYGVDCEKLYGKLYDSILNSLYRLNDFSREHKFWHNTNEKPTIYKLREFCRLKLSENPNDLLALWTILALIIKDGAPENDLSQIIEKLIQFKELDSEILIEMNLTGDIFYDGNGEDFAGWLIKFGLQNEAKPTLNNLATSKIVFVSDWAQTVLNRMENQ